MLMFNFNPSEEGPRIYFYFSIDFFFVADCGIEKGSC
jgi:hypothetical protein